MIRALARGSGAGGGGGNMSEHLEILGVTAMGAGVGGFQDFHIS